MQILKTEINTVLGNCINLLKHESDTQYEIKINLFNVVHIASLDVIECTSINGYF